MPQEKLLAGIEGKNEKLSPQVASPTLCCSLKKFQLEKKQKEQVEVTKGRRCEGLQGQRDVPHRDEFPRGSAVTCTHLTGILL